MNNQQSLYLSQEQINQLFQREFEQRDERLSSFKKNDAISSAWKTEENEETRPTNDSMMMILRDEYNSLQQEYERRKDMEEKFKDDINNLMRELKQKTIEVEMAKKDHGQLIDQFSRRESTISNLRTQIQETNQREQKAVMELAEQFEEHLQLKQQLEILQQKYGNLDKQHKFEMERKDKQIDQLKHQIVQLNDENEKLKNDREINSSRLQPNYQSSILFSKTKPIIQLQQKSNFDSKVTFGKKSK